MAKKLTKAEFVKWRTAAKKPKLTAAQLEGRYQAYLKRPAAKAAKKPAVNNRPEGWGNEGFVVTPTNRNKYPEKNYELVEGLNGTKWARPRTEMTGIDPELQGLIKSYDDETGRMTGQVKRVYDGLGQELTAAAQASSARLGGLADLATRAQPASFSSGAVTTPGGQSMVTPAAGQVDQVQADQAATQQRMLTRAAALDVNTANLDAQQAPLIGAREIGRLSGERSQGREDLRKGLLMQSRSDAAAARNAKMELLGSQLKSETDINKLKAQIESREKIEAAKIEGSNARTDQTNRTRAAIAAQQSADKQAAAAAKAKKPAATAAKYNTLKNQWIAKATGYMPYQRGMSGGEYNQKNVLLGTFGGKSPHKDGTPKPGNVTINQFYQQGVQAGVRPSDMVKMVMAAGVKLGVADVYNLLVRTLPAKNARAVTKQITGYDWRGVDT